MSVDVVEEVESGTWVKVAGFVPGAKSVFHLIPETDSNWREHKVSVGSRFGRALLGAKVGDIVPFDLFGDQLKLTVVEVGRD